MSRKSKCKFCGKGYDINEFGRSYFVQDLGVKQIKSRMQFIYDDGSKEKNIKHYADDTGNVLIARTQLTIIPESQCLEVVTSSGYYEDARVFSDLKIQYCPFCGRKFEGEVYEQDS